MKTSYLNASILALGLVPLLTVGCVERRVYVQGPPVVVAAPPGEVVVTEAPPVPAAEVVVQAPGPTYVWAPGYWTWQGRWVWISGRWMLPPRPQAVWVGGYWAPRGHGYVWVGGRWR
jgi:hypothetical protein